MCLIGDETVYIIGSFSLFFRAIVVHWDLKVNVVQRHLGHQAHLEIFQAHQVHQV